MARIPIAGDVVELIGPAAERVENRSLLLDKFVFHKLWPVEINERGREVKWDDASRWSFMRIAEGGGQILGKDATDKRYRARGQNVEADNRDRLLAEADLAESLARVSWDSKAFRPSRPPHTPLPQPVQGRVRAAGLCDHRGIAGSARDQSCRQPHSKCRHLPGPLVRTSLHPWFCRKGCLPAPGIG